MEQGIVKRQEQGLEAIRRAETEEIRRIIAPKASDTEIRLFARYCLANGFDPFSGDAYMIPFAGRFAIIKSVNVNVRRAALHPAFRSYKAGIVLTDKEGKLVEREGTIRLPGETLVGGWCRWYTKDGTEPIYHSIMLEKYDRTRKGQKGTPWETIPEEMCQKVAINQVAVRFAGRAESPEILGSYSIEGETIPVVTEAADGQVDTATGEILNGTAKVLPAKAAAQGFPQPQPAPKESQQAIPQGRVTNDQLRAITALRQRPESDLTEAELVTHLEQWIGVTNLRDLTQQQAAETIKWLQKAPQPAQAQEPKGEAS